MNELTESSQRKPLIAGSMRSWLASLTLFLVTMTVFWPVTRHPFINYDDPDYVTANQHVLPGLTSDGLRWAVTQIHGEATYWHPITWLSHMLDCQLFGLNAGGHHLVNLLIHSANAILLFLLLRGMTSAFWRSFMVAAIFAIHPIQVDTVAWIAERKNVLSTMFFFLTLLCYFRYSRLRSLFWYAVTFGCYALGLMTKPMLVTLPGILLLLDFWPLRRFAFARGNEMSPHAINPVAAESVPRLLIEKAPFVLLAVASAAITLLAHQGLGMEHYSRGLSLGARLANAAVSYCRYIGKVAWPRNLSIFYPHPHAWPIWITFFSIMVLAVFSLAACRAWRRYPFVAVGWFWFVGTLTPVLGIIQVGMQSMADRFAYVPIIGLLVAAVWGAAQLLARFPRITLSLATIALVCCMAVTGRQLRYWQNSEIIWRHALAVTRDNFVAHHNLGYVLLLQQKYDEAVSQTEEALRLRPDLIEAEYQLGFIKDQQHKFAEAIPYYQKALELKWDWAMAHRALLSACYQAGQTNLVVAHLEKLVRSAPDNPGGHLELAQALQAANRLPEALAHYRDAARLAPRWTTPLNDLAWLLATSPQAEFRNGPEAVALAQRACDLSDWKQPQMIGTLAAAYAENGNFAQAVETAQRAVKVAQSIGQKEITERNEKLLELYKQKQPYRDTGHW